MREILFKVFTGWQAFCGLGLLMEKSKVYGGQALRVAQLAGLNWLLMAYMTYSIPADSEAGFHLGLVVGIYNMAFALAAGPMRLTPINKVEKFLLVPVSFILSSALIYDLLA